MSFPDEIAQRVTAAILDRIGDAGLVLYPVRASAVRAYLGAGNAGTSIRGVVERRPILNDDLGQAVGVQNVAIVLTLDAETAEAHSVSDRQCSVAYKGRYYDIALVTPDDPGAVECTLRELL